MHAGMKELFKSIDEDGSGTITVEEMRKAMSQWGHKISEAELGNLMSIADVDGDGLIDYNEFVAATMHMSKLEKEELLQKAFQQLDKWVVQHGVYWGQDIAHAHEQAGEG
jgi:calcium-dependent protein kinase